MVDGTCYYGNDALNAGLSKYVEGRRFTLSRNSLLSVSSFIGWLVSSDNFHCSALTVYLQPTKNIHAQLPAVEFIA